MSERRGDSVIPIVPAAAGADDAATQMVSLYQSEDKIYARAVSGWFAGWRWALVWATQLLFYGLPWLQWNSRQAVLFDLAARRFYIFDLVLHPQDFIYLTGLLILSAYGLFLFTAVAGRLWCGYACPQTVYTEIFMWVERKIEGDRVARIRLDAAPWTAGKLLRKGGKQVAWIAIGLWTGFTFVSYFTPVRELALSVVNLGGGQQSLGPWETFWVLFYGLATYGNAGFLREQVCKYMCPYARFQSAMFDKDTLIIGYDDARGEPRGSRSRSAGRKASNKGDCIDCKLCVQVCPTGIDIRKGLQYECIGCAACIDVCDGVMDKMNYPRGLIRYSTQNAIQQGWSSAQMWRRVARPRVLIYTAVLVAIATAFVASLWLRTPFRVDVVRDRGVLARMVEDGRIENVYRLQVMNGTESTQRFRITVDGLPQAQIVTRNEVEIASTEARWVPVSVQITPQVARQIGPGVHALTFRIERLGDAAADTGTVREKSTFMVPR
ncbi:MAG: cytochrome c oxidase accessory protein CcoG [Rhizobacter sp.]|nr:cytochrome c oxidase accessory protein CcoG [Rhizobacter sp.]